MSHSLTNQSTSEMFVLSSCQITCEVIMFTTEIILREMSQNKMTQQRKS